MPPARFMYSRLCAYLLVLFAGAAPDSSKLHLTVLPHGVDASNETARQHWEAHPTIPTARVTLLITVEVGEWLGQQLSGPKGAVPESELWLNLRLDQSSGATEMMRVQLSRSYSLNIGASGTMNLTATLDLAGTHQGVASGETCFTIAPLAISPADLVGALVPTPPVLGDQPGDPGGGGGGGGDGEVDASPPVAMPPSMAGAFTMGGRAKVYALYFDDRADRDKSYPHYPRAAVDALVARAERREEHYYGYTDTFLFAALDAHPIAGKRVLLLGSNVPWYEAVCLARGAALCVTLEYNPLRYDLPEDRARTFTVAEWKAARLLGEPCRWPDRPMSCRFDAIFSISSFEHDGLGRYGDPLNPEGDLEAMASLLDYLDPNEGKVFLSVPVGEDAVYWNAERMYGARRLPLLLARYQPLAAYGVQLAALQPRPAGPHPGQHRGEHPSEPGGAAGDAAGGRGGAAATSSALPEMVADGWLLKTARERHARMTNFSGEGFQPVFVLAASRAGGGSGQVRSAPPKN